MESSVETVTDHFHKLLRTSQLKNHHDEHGREETVDLDKVQRLPSFESKSLNCARLYRQLHKVKERRVPI